VGHVARLGDVRSAYKILGGKLKGKRPLGNGRKKIKMVFRGLNSSG